MNDNMEAQVSENTLKSVTNQTNANALTKAQINVGDYPNFIEGFGDYIYVANSLSDTVSVINPNNNAVVKSIDVGSFPTFIKGFGDYIYVANSGSDTVSVINPNTNTVVKSIDVGSSPTFIGGFGDYIYVTNFYSSTVSVINPNSNTVVKNITVGEGPNFIAQTISTILPVYIKDLNISATIGHLGYIYIANSDSSTVSVINPNNNTVVKNITVGEGPGFIATATTPFGDYIYIANFLSDTVSVIGPNTNTVVKNITVGEGPNFIATIGDYPTIGEYIYVTNFYSSTVSVINPNSNTVVKNITVGEGPNFIATTPFGDYIYIANSDSSTVSVINPNNNTVVKNITVGKDPSFIAAIEDALYVVNSGSGTLSLVDPITNEEVAGIKFDIKPFGAGQIICNGLEAPINRYLYVSSDAECTAKPNKGFEFSSWTENLAQNSSITVNASSSTGSSWTQLLDIFGVESNDPAATLTVNQFGKNYTAYFRALPPAVPAEYIASLFTVVVTAIVGSLLIPSAISWFKSKKQISKLNSFHQQMAVVYSDGKVDETDIDQLNTLNKNISDSYTAGKISNDQYTHLKNEVSMAFQKIYKRKIESLADPNIETIIKIKHDIKDAYADGKLTELHYSLLNEKISDTFDNKSDIN
jgi:YVTN family beta-propeller protein